MKRFIENRPSSDTARRPLPPLAGNLLFLGALFAMSLLVMAIEKPLFLLWYHAQAAEASAAELALVVWNGLKLDQTVAGYITALPLLVVLAALWIPGRWSRSVLKGYLLVIAAVAATAFAANLALYEYWAFPLDSSVRDYEPLGALDGGEDGLMFYRAIVQHWTQILRPGGWLMFEVGEDQADAVMALMKDAKYTDVTALEDTAGIRRVVVGRI